MSRAVFYGIGGGDSSSGSVGSVSGGRGSEEVCITALGRKLIKHVQKST